MISKSPSQSSLSLFQQLPLEYWEVSELHCSPSATLLVSFLGGFVWLSAFSHLVDATLICHDYCWVLACHWLQEINGFGLSLCCMGQSNSLFFAKWGFPSIHLFILSIQPSLCIFFSLSHSRVSSLIDQSIYPPSPNQRWHSVSLSGIENTHSRFVKRILFLLWNVK